MALPVLPLPYLLDHHAHTRAQQVAFSTSQRSITFAALAVQTRRIAAHLLLASGSDGGIRRGDRVAILLPRCLEFVEAILAVTRAAGIGVPLDPRSSAVELKWALEDCGARVVITDRARLEMVRGAVGVDAPTGVLVVVVGASESDADDDGSSSIIAKGQRGRMVRYEDWTMQESSGGQESNGNCLLDDLGLDEPAWMHYTSGTTGTPKGVLSSQRAWILSAAIYAETMGITAADKLFWPLPLYHAFGHSLCIIGTTVVGTTVYLTGQDEGVLTSLRGCKEATVVAGVPSTYHELVTELAGTHLQNALPRPRMCISAGGTALAGVKSHVEEVFGVSLSNNYGCTEACGPVAATTPTKGSAEMEQILGVPLLNRYGCTESCGAIAAKTPCGLDHGDLSCGTPLSHMKIKIVDANTDTALGVAVEDGHEGEIWICGPSMMLQYWNPQSPLHKSVSSPDEDSWYRTGDLGRRIPDSGGHLVVTGRLHELIRRGSETIHPAEVERVILSCPGVQDVVVTGIPHDMLGETPAAFIVPEAHGAALDLMALLAACRAVLPDYKVPARFLEIEALPRTKTGKLRRRAAVNCRSRPLTARRCLTRTDMLEALVLAEVRGACGLGLEEPLKPSLPFVNLGMNSFAGVVLRDRLASLTGLDDLPTTLVFDHPTPAAVSEYLRTRLSEDIPALRPPVPTQDPTTPSDSPSPEQTTDDDPIAIISMACRYPGAISSPEDLWDAVYAGKDMTTPFPTDRGWDLAALANPDPSASGTSITSRGGFLADMALFDATPFHMSPREALATDPQHRLLLETTWHLAERARIAPSALRGTPTGVFIGLMYSDYAGRFHTHNTPRDLEAHLGLGSAASVAAGRLAYAFDFRGPTLAIDTACSSSLVAIHLAAASLRAGECTLAVAGGVTVMAAPRPFVLFSAQGGLARDGRCRSYAAGADGTAWGEGVGLVMLARLAEARRRGYEVLGVVRGSAVGSDGAGSNGLTAPSGAAQERVMRAALGGLVPGEVDVLEGHGTATRLGDEIEAAAVAAVYGGLERGEALLLASVKSNIGHTQAAAGVAGVIKMVMAMKHGVVPKSMHVDKPLVMKGEVDVVTENRLWPCRKRGGGGGGGGGREGEIDARRAAVSSFGIGGTNAHIILEQYINTKPETEKKANCTKTIHPWLFSGADKAAMCAQAGALLEVVDNEHREHQGHAATDIAFSLATTRSPLTHRAMLIAPPRGEDDTTSKVQRASALRALAQNLPHPDVATGIVSGSPPRLAFIFSPQGSLKKHSGKGIQELCASFPIFDTAFRMACNELGPGLGFEHDLFEVIQDDPEDIFTRTDVSQAAIFAFEVAMCRLLQSFGIRPDAVLGHSVGEVAAAHIAGFLSLSGAAALVAARGRLMAALPRGEDAMASIVASEEDVAMVLAELPGGQEGGGRGKCAIAAVNSPTSVVVSGPIDTVTTIVHIFASRRQRASLLKGVSHAFHSPLMDPVADDLHHALLNNAAFQASHPQPKPTILLISTVTGRPADTAQLTSPEHWTRHVRAPVRFADALATLAVTTTAGPVVYLEVGASAPLSPHMPPDAIATHGAVHTLLDALGRLWLRGVPVDWRAVFVASGARAVDLPVYQFQRRRYWLDPPRVSVDQASRFRGGTDLDHPVLTHAALVPGLVRGDVVCHGYLALETHGWLADHVVGGQMVVPAAALAEMALRAGREAVEGAAVRLEELAMIAPLVVPADEGLTIQVVVGKVQANGGRDNDNDDGDVDVDGNEHHHHNTSRIVDVYSRPERAGVRHEWTRHTTGTLISSSSGLLRCGNDMPAEEWQAVDVHIAEAYAMLADAGLSYGPVFQCVRALWRSEDGQCLRAQIQLPEIASGSKSSLAFDVHPALLDAAMHAWVLAMTAGNPAESVQLRLPFLLRGVQILGAGDMKKPLTVYTKKLSGEDGVLSLTLTDADGNLIAVVEEVVGRPWKAAPRTADLFKLEWTALETRSGHNIATRKGSHEVPDRVIHMGELEGQQHPTEFLPDAVHSATASALEIIQQWSAEEAFASDSGRLVITTNKASTRDPDLAAAAVWGLIRSAQAEFGPDRLVLVDLDGTQESLEALPRAQASGKGLVAIQSGRVMIPRITRLDTKPPPPSPPLDTSGTVLITGGTGALGSLLAHHLVQTHDAKSLLLLSRAGPAAPGAQGLAASLAAAGATTARIEACDVSDRAQLAPFFLPGASTSPITAIIHAAGVLDDGLLSTTQTAERVSAVLRPKVDAAWLLHELAPRGTQLVLFSSAAGVLGNRGQAGYAAGNGFLDGLARYRRARGFYTVSLAWGPWEKASGMAGGLGGRRGGRGWLVGMTDEQGLGAFDAAVRMGGGGEEEDGDGVVVPLVLRGGSVRSLDLVGLHPASSPIRAPDTLWREMLAACPAQEDRAAALLGLVRAELATILGYQQGESLPDRPFTELGLDSFTAVQLRNRISTLSGLKGLPATLAFDANTLTALVESLLARMDKAMGDRGEDGKPPDRTASTRTVAEAEADHTSASTAHDIQQATLSPTPPQDNNALQGLAALYHRMCQAGQHTAATYLLIAASLALPKFSSSSTPSSPPPRRLATGSVSKPALILLPDFAPILGRSRYAALAATLPRLHDIYELQHPLRTAPASLDALAELHATTIRDGFVDRAVVLLGYSAGGCVAHAVACRLLSDDHHQAGGGAVVVGLVLIDTYAVAQGGEDVPAWLVALPAAAARRAYRHGADGREEDEALAMMGAYCNVIAGWSAGPLPGQCRTFIVRASEAVPGAGEGWRPAEGEWADRTVDVPGHHLAMLEGRGVQAVAEVVGEWLEQGGEACGGD